MQNLRIIIFNVEHGFCAYVRSPNEYTLLIDCGSRSSFSPIEYILKNKKYLSYSYSNKEYKLAQFILSHPHDDHLTDIKRLKNDFRPFLLLRQPYDWDEIKVAPSENGYENLDDYSKWQKEYIPSTVKLDAGMKLSTLHLEPKKAKKLNEKNFVNNSSIVAFIEYQGFKIVFPGDIETEAWEELLKEEEFRNRLRGTSVFVTSHHGHSSGYHEKIFDYMDKKPDCIIVSAHKKDESVDNIYLSGSKVAKGVSFNYETRYMLSTRKDGSILIEAGQDGKVSYSTLPEN